MNHPDLFAFLGLDEFGSGVVGIKQGRVPAGMIPLVSLEAHKLEKVRSQIEEQAQRYGKKIYLCNFKFNGVLWATSKGDPWD